MKVVLEVKNNSKIIKPSKNNVILFDGKEWYVTTKQDLFDEYEKKVDDKLNKLDILVESLKNENINFKNEVSKNILDITKIVRKIYEKE